MLQHESLINSVTVITLAIKFTKSTFVISIISPCILYVIVNMSMHVNNILPKTFPETLTTGSHVTMRRGRVAIILTFSILHVNKIGYILYRISVRNIA